MPAAKVGERESGGRDNLQIATPGTDPEGARSRVESPAAGDSRQKCTIPDAAKVKMAEVRQRVVAGMEPIPLQSVRRGDEW